MGLTIDKLTAETRTFTWKVLGEDVEVTYRPGVLTQAWNAKNIWDSLPETLVALDITNGKGKPIALDSESLRTYLPVPFMRKLAQAIFDDSTVDPTTAETSGAS